MQSAIRVNLCVLFEQYVVNASSITIPLSSEPIGQALVMDIYGGNDS